MLKPFSAQRLPGLHSLSWRLLGCEPAFAGWLLAFQLWLALLWFYYQGFGVIRGVILCGLLFGLFMLRRQSPARHHACGTSFLPEALRLLLILAVLLDLCLMFVSCTTSLHRSKIPMDEGQTSWRAARLLWKDEDPYGAGALVDFGAYRSRAEQRSAAGIVVATAPSAEHAAIARYDVTLDRTLRSALLPVPPNGSPAQVRETHLYGYKYGPVVLSAAALSSPFGVPAAVLFLNGLACFALYGVSWRILRKIASPQIALAGAAMLALLLDRHITRNYIDRSATDVWALLFGSLAVLAVITRRPLACAASVALAIGCKSIPGLLFAPLLLKFRSPVPALVCAALSLCLYLPWLLWDPAGVMYNVFLWPLYMSTDFTSWQFFLPAWMTFATRAAVLCALIVLWVRYITGREQRLFWTLAVTSTLVLLAGGFLRNGYVPWASLWAVMAVAEAFGSTRFAARAQRANSEGREPVQQLVLARESL